MCQGATQNYAGILATRFLLGLAEAGYYPGVLYVVLLLPLPSALLIWLFDRYHLSFWYPTEKMPLRLVSFVDLRFISLLHCQ